jgi:hypothetical protein
MNKRTVTCYHLGKLKGFPGCCDSCHEDNDEYGYLICYPFFERSREYEVCCHVATWLTKTFPDKAK